MNNVADLQSKYKVWLRAAVLSTKAFVLDHAQYLSQISISCHFCNIAADGRLQSYSHLIKSFQIHLFHHYSFLLLTTYTPYRQHTRKRTGTRKSPNTQKRKSPSKRMRKNLILLVRYSLSHLMRKSPICPMSKSLNGRMRKSLIQRRKHHTKHNT